MPAESVGWVTLQVAAALAKWRSRANAVRYCRCLSSMIRNHTGRHHSEQRGRAYLAGGGARSFAGTEDTIVAEDANNGPGFVPPGVDTISLLAAGFFPTHAPRPTHRRTLPPPSRPWNAAARRRCIPTSPPSRRRRRSRITSPRFARHRGRRPACPRSPARSGSRCRRWVSGKTMRAFLQVNQKDGFDCQSCAWPAPDGKRHRFEFCENGAKAIADEGMNRIIGADFFAEWSVEALAAQSDQWLNAQGRLSEPLLLREGCAHYEPISWDDAFDLIGQELRALPSPDHAAFYTSGRASNEAAFLYQLFVRQFGTNNLPDCSNMCHESSGTALTESYGIGKGTVTLEDFEHTDLILIVGQNPGTNHPRMLTSLEHAKQHGARIIAINPLAEPGFLRFTDPNPDEYATPDPLRGGHPRTGEAAGGPSSSGADQRRHRAAQGADEGADRGGRIAGRRTRPRLHPRSHRRIPRALCRPPGNGVARHRRGLRHLAGDDRAGGVDDRAVEADDRLLGDGPDPAQGRGRHHPHAGEPAAPGRPHGAAGRRHRLRAGALQRAGRPHHGHLGAAHRTVPRRAGPRVRLRLAAPSRPRHGGHDLGDARGRDQRVRLAGRQFPLGDAGHGLHRGGAAAVRAHGSHRHQAQPVAPGHRQTSPDPAVPRPVGEGSGRVPHGGGCDGGHQPFSRALPAGLTGPQERSVHHRGDRRRDAGQPVPAGLGGHGG